MRALTVRPGVQGSLSVEEIAEPEPEEGAVLVEAVAVGLCGTDAEIINGEYGQAPPGEDFLVLGHENLGPVQQTPSDSGLCVGDLVVGIVRRPDPVPCPARVAGERDMCRNDRYTEHGIRGLRAFWQPAVVAVTGAGPVGLLAALLGVQRGLRVHVFDRVTEGPKPDLVRSVGATFHHVPLPDSGVRADVVIECTGVPQVVTDAVRYSPADAIVCSAGVSNAGTDLRLDMGALNRGLVLGNKVIFGSVNANMRHYAQATRALGAADDDWLTRLITRTVPLHRYHEAFVRQPDDVKVVLDLQEAQR